MVETAEFMTTGAVARLLGVNAQTVRDWITGGHLAVIVTPSGRRLVPRAELERIATPRLMTPSPK